MGVAGRGIGSDPVLGDIGLEPRRGGDVEHHVQVVAGAVAALAAADEKLEGVEGAHAWERHSGGKGSAGLGGVFLPLLGRGVEAPEIVEILAPVAPAKDEDGLTREACTMAIPGAWAWATLGNLYLIPLSFCYKNEL